ncbi:MAG: PP2C family protein-serine/threonine phosphatase [Thermoanaerobaculia bacterium]
MTADGDLAISKSPAVTPAAAERRLAREALEAWCRLADLPGAALYLEREGALRRELMHGKGPFPAAWPVDGDSASVEELVATELGGGAMVAAPSAVEPQGPVRLALEAAARALTLAEQLRRQRFAASYHGVELQALYDVGLAIASTLEIERLVPEILAHAVALLDARRGALYLTRDGRLEREATLAGTARQVALPDEPTVRCLLAGEQPDAQDLLPGARHLLAVAVGDESRPRGLLVVADKESRSGVGPFSRGDRQTLSLFANQAAIALETAELHAQALEKEGLERELSLASQIQARLLPTSFPRLPGHEVYGWSRPARQVGGDYYDLLPLQEQRFGFVLGDVTGKGMPAALMVSTLHAAWRLLAAAGEAQELLTRINGYLFRSSAANHFATLFFGSLDPASGHVRYINAGHNPAVVVSADGSSRLLPSGGLPIGLLEGSRWQEQETRLAPGELLCVYSDGLTEANAADGEELGLDRLTGLLVAGRDRPLADLMDDLRAQLDAWAADTPQSDDQTVLLLRRR